MSKRSLSSRSRSLRTTLISTILFFLTLLLNLFTYNEHLLFIQYGLAQRSVSSRGNITEFSHHFLVHYPEIKTSDNNIYTKYVYDSCYRGIRWAINHVRTEIAERRKNKSFITHPDDMSANIVYFVLDEEGTETTSGGSDFSYYKPIIAQESVNAKYAIGPFGQLSIDFFKNIRKSTLYYGCNPYDNGISSVHGEFFRTYNLGVEPKQIKLVLTDWLKKLKIKNIVFIDAKTHFSSFEKHTLLDAFENAEIAITYHCDIPYNDFSLKNTGGESVNTYINDCLNRKKIKHSRAFLVLGRPDIVAYTIATAYENKKVNDEYIWITNTFPDIIVAQSILKDDEKVKKAFKSLFVIRSDPEYSIDLESFVNDATLDEYNKQLANLHGESRYMFSTGASCVLLMYNSYRKDLNNSLDESHSSKFSNDYSNITKFEVEGSLKNYMNKNRTPITVHALTERTTCSRSDPDSGYVNNGNTDKYPNMCFNYDIISTYTIKDNNTEFDINTRNEPVFYNNTNYPPKDTMYKVFAKPLSLRVLILFLMVVTMVSTLAVAYLLCSNRNTIPVKAACPPLCVLIIIGLLIGTLRIGIGAIETNILTCQYSLLISVLSNLLTFVPLALKNLRTYFIFTRSSLQNLSNNKAMFISLGVVAMPTLSLLIDLFYVKRHPILHEYYLYSRNEPIVVHICPNIRSYYSQVSIFVYVGSLILLVIFNIIVAIKCKSLEHRYNESKKIAYCMANLVAVTAITVGIQRKASSFNSIVISLVHFVGLVVDIFLIFGNIVIFNNHAVAKFFNIKGKQDTKLKLVNISGARVIDTPEVRINNLGTNASSVNPHIPKPPSTVAPTPSSSYLVNTFKCNLVVRNSLFSYFNSMYACKIVWISQCNSAILICVESSVSSSNTCSIKKFLIDIDYSKFYIDIYSDSNTICYKLDRSHIMSFSFSDTDEYNRFTQCIKFNPD